MTGQVLTRTEGQSTFWQFVKEHLSATEIRRFNSLENVNNDSGRGRGLKAVVKPAQQFSHTKEMNKDNDLE